tara:strand:+ start:502 stop:702 length:201 start_codon:yes stop_codon:yes gene_type:complete
MGVSLRVVEEYEVYIPQTEDIEEAINIFNMDSTDVYETKHKGFIFIKGDKELEEHEERLQNEEIVG